MNFFQDFLLECFSPLFREKFPAEETKVSPQGHKSFLPVKLLFRLGENSETFSRKKRSSEALHRGVWVLPRKRVDIFRFVSGGVSGSES